MLEIVQLQPARNKGMDGVPALVHHSGEIAHGIRRVHKDKRRAAFGQGIVVTARSLTLARLEIEQVIGFHDAQALAHIRVERCKAADAFIDQLFAVVEGFQCRKSGGIHFGIVRL